MQMMKNPPHVGKSIRIACLDETGLTVTQAAKQLGYSRQALSNVINGHTAITPRMAVALSRVFGSSPDTWLRMQLNYDLAQRRLKVKSMKFNDVTVDIITDEEIHEHYKGGKYIKLHEAYMESYGNGMDAEIFVVYKCIVSDIIWVRPKSEFDDKFKLVTS